EVSPPARSPPAGSGSERWTSLHRRYLMQWINSPPIEHVTDAEFTRLAKDFIEDLEQNWMLKRPKSPEGKEWNKLVDAAITEANVYGSRGDKFVYKLNGKAAALMRTSVQADSIKVEDLSAHKGSEGGGAIMIEYAVKLSQDRGKKGVLTLFAAGDERLQ